MGRTALHYSALLLLLIFVSICSNCMTSTVSAGIDKPPPTESGGTGWRPCHRGQHCGRHATPSGNSVGTVEPGRPRPSAGLNGARPNGQPTLRRNGAPNPSALLPILATISLVSLLFWSWRRKRRRNSAASQTRLVAVSDRGQQTIRFMPVSPRSDTIVPGLQGRSR
jgi:hypothetical protein